MTLHENLERKRRQNIVELDKSGACHLCECTSGSRSYRRFVSNDDDDQHLDRDETEEEDSFGDLPSEEVVPMRSCMCYGYGNTTRPHPLRVCEMCIADDLTTGRIRSCAICGVVACDEDCGIELAEATDHEEWNNKGCLECRGMESFSEMELFRRRPYPNGIPRATRICTNCVELFSLFSFGIKYHFACRYFKCSRLLVPSRVVELKRFLKPFPLSLLPEELMNSIVDFLGGKDLFSFGLVCTSTFRKVEHVSMDIVTRFNHELPTGPTHIIKSGKKNIKKTMVYAEGKNVHSLRPPNDGKTWVGVLNQMEQLTRDIFYFDFQMKGGDEGVAMRYLRRRDKLSFERIYSKGTGPIAPYFETSGLSVRGGQVLVTKYKWHHGSLMEEREDRNNVRSIIFSTDKVLESGIHRAIIRYYCICESESLGSIGILRQQNSSDDQSVTWAQSSSIACQGRMEEHVFGMEYDANHGRLSTYKRNGKTNKMESTTAGRTQTIASEGGKLCFAAALSSGSVGIKGNQLSIRACSENEWSAFLSHTAEKNIIPRIRGRIRRGEERLMRYLDHRANTTDENGEYDIAGRVEVEHMMDMLMEDEMEGLHDTSDSELEDEMPVERDVPMVLPNAAAGANPPAAAAGNLRL